MFVNVFNVTHAQEHQYTNTEIFSLFCQQTTIYLSFTLLVFLFVTTALTQIDAIKHKFTHLFNFIKITNIAILSSIFTFTTIKFMLYLVNFKSYSFTGLSYQSRWLTLQFDYLPFTPTFDLNSSVLSDVIILLAFSSGIVCLHLLGEKNLVKNLSNISIFSAFLISIIIMVYTCNILVMFIGFELLFLPTLYFLYHHGYVERLDKTLKILLYWTLFGAFLVLSSIAYMYGKYKVLNFYTLSYLEFSFSEKLFLSLCIFFGFGTKVPVFPFHYWLTKIHVEAPAGFSIFLSGFLVKAAIYCFYYFNLLLNFHLLTTVISIVALLSIMESSIKMWTQTDFKKLIAFATIQEMNLILLLLINYQNLLDYSLLLFILIHGWLSTLMFFLVDIIQKKTLSRNIVAVSGLANNFPELKFIVWFVLLMFMGFPLTVKFLIEWQIFGNLILQSKIVYVSVFILIVAIGAIGFAKQLIIILYGSPRNSEVQNYTLSKRDKFLFYFIIGVLVTLTLINYFLG